MTRTGGQRRIAAVLFDLDDTLLDWSKRTGDWREITGHHLNNVHEYLTSHGYALPAPEEFLAHYVEILVSSWDDAKKTWAGVYFADVLSRSLSGFGLDPDDLDLDELMHVYGWRPMPGVVPYDDAIPVLRTLQERGYKIGLITNSMFPMWMRDIELRAYDLYDYFEARTTSGDVGFMKPHPAIFEHTLRQLKVAPDQAVFVGDRPENDIVGAKDVGLVSVLITPDHLDREMHDIEPDYTITCLSDLLPILECLEQVEDDKARTK